MNNDYTNYHNYNDYIYKNLNLSMTSYDEYTGKFNDYKLLPCKFRDEKVWISQELLYDNSYYTSNKLPNFFARCKGCKLCDKGI